MRSAVLLIIFNRPEVTSRVFDVLREVKPPRLFVAGDGPRQGRAGEQERCLAARQIATRIDWDCELSTLFRDTNLGCKRAVSSAIDWFFGQVEEGVVLEDDTLPDPSFFRYCDELLERYRHDERVGAISGNNFQFGQRRSDYDYYFSYLNHIWGWASWRRAWSKYDVGMSNWPEIRSKRLLEGFVGHPLVSVYWSEMFDKVYHNQIDTWDYQWTFACLSNSMLTALPKENLVSNIGFGPEATHTTGSSPLACLPVVPISFPLKHPPYVLRDAAADRFTERRVFGISVPESLVEPAPRLPNPEESQAVMALVAKCLGHLQLNENEAALQAIEGARNLQVSQKDLEYVRALCLLRMGRLPEALEALRAELRWHPLNRQAEEMLMQLTGRKE